MGDLRYKVIVGGGVRLGDRTLQVNEVFDPEDYGNRRWQTMVKRGRIIPVSPDEVSSVASEGEEPASPVDSGEADTPSPIDEMTRKELVARIEELGFTEEEVEGTGSNDYVTVDDLRAFVRKQEE